MVRANCSTRCIKRFAIHSRGSHEVFCLVSGKDV